MSIKFVNSDILTMDALNRGITFFAKKHNVNGVFLFGSYARGNANKNSDIDLLIDKGNIKTLIDLIKFQQDLENYFGKRVDVITTESIKFDYFLLNEIENDGLVVYDVLNRNTFAKFMEACYEAYNPFKVCLPEAI